MGSDSKSGGSKGSGSYDYFGTIAGAVCAGPCTELLAVIVDGAEVWPKARAWADGESISINNLRAHSGKTWKALTNHTASSSNEPPDATNWVQYSLQASSDSDDLTIEGYGDLTIYWGTETQLVDPLLEASGNDAEEEHPDYLGICYIVLKDFLLGRERESAPNVEVVVRKTPVQTVIVGDPAQLSDGQANIMAVIAEVFTHENGLGQSDFGLSTTSFQAAADALHDAVDMCGVSVLLDGQVTFRQFLSDLAAIGDIFIRYNPSTALIEAGVFTHGEAPSSYTTLTIDDFADGDKPKFKSQGWATVNTRAVVQFNDRERGFKQSSIKADDLRAHRVLGEHRPMTLQRPSITRASQALLHAAETLRTLGRPQLSSNSASIRREKARNIRPGDYVRVDIDLEPGGATLLQFFRVMDREIPPLGPITLTLDADETLAPVPYAPGEEPREEDVQTVPEITNHRFIEAPILLADEVDSVLALIERPNELIVGAHVWFDTVTGGDFIRIGTGTGFALKASLRTALADSDTTLEIVALDQADFDWLELQPGDLGAADDTLLAILVKREAGYTGGSALATTSLTGAGTGATLTPTIVDGKIVSATVDAGGTGYSPGEQITVVDATGTGAILEVTVDVISGDEVASVTVLYGGTADLVAEDADGYAHIEVCSISAQALVSDDDYDIDVLRARRGTRAKAFDVADTEVWIIPRASLASFFHADFATIRQNRINGDTPDLGYFRLAPYTYVAERDVEDCSSIEFRWPEKSQSAPNLELTSPTVSPHSVTSPYPKTVQFTGTWSDGDSDLISYQILTRKGTGSNVLVKEEVFTSTDSKEFDEPVIISGPGTWFVTLRAFDALGLKFERIITVSAGGATAKCAKPEVFWAGNKLALSPTLNYGTHGILNLRCQTPGSTMEYRYRANAIDGLGSSAFSAWTSATSVQIGTYQPDNTIPVTRPNQSENFVVTIEVRADAATHTQSDTTTILVQI